MPYTLENALIVKKERLSADAYGFWLANQALAKAEPGQFVNVKCDGFQLRRPISVCETRPGENLLRIVFEVRGQGTEALAKKNEGDVLDILGPLGHGFELLPKGKKAVLVGGGIGTPPLVALAHYYGRDAVALCGFQTAGEIILQEDFASLCAGCFVTTDDGSAGRKGFVDAALKDELQRALPDIIYACGPGPMLRSVAAIAKEHGVRCQLSLEERMGCGIGACLVCACTVRKNGKEGYHHVCKDGPVFEAEDVVFE